MYLRAGLLAWKQSTNKTTETAGREVSDPTILFTTESIKMAKAQKSFCEANTNATNIAATTRHPFRFEGSILTNFKDVTPNTGLIGQSLRAPSSDQKHTQSFTADENMFSVISTLSFQLLANVTLGNCCSNFHMLIHECVR